MSSADVRSAAVTHWWRKAQESLAAAERDVEAKAYSLAVNRIYYAAFYAVSAALLERHVSFRRHSGVRSAFHREFVKTNLLPVEWGKFYDQLFEDRQEGDYLALVEFDQEYVSEQLRRCRKFLLAVRPLMSSVRNG